jgi:hypothetical protein
METKLLRRISFLAVLMVVLVSLFAVANVSYAHWGRFYYRPYYYPYYYYPYYYYPYNYYYYPYYW